MNVSKSLNNFIRLISFLLGKLRKCGLNSSLLMASVPVMAQSKTPKLTPVDSILPMLGGLLLILVFIFALAFLFKRFSNFSPSSKSIKVLETQMIGTKEKLMIVKVQEQCFLIGVTSHSISQLGELSAESENSAIEVDPSSEDVLNPADTSTNFKSILSNIVRKSIGVKNSSVDTDKLAG